MRYLNLKTLKDLLGAIDRAIATLPPGEERDKQTERRAEVLADIQMIQWAASPLKPPER